ncbi:universal stress protein [Actinoplanes sp. NPDC049802]|uniref:universal stress protein n=1 Tax=Actinoplanes sp. NPDC049802 TaxID=3154742 RepID=UPI0033DC3B22
MLNARRNMGHGDPEEPVYAFGNPARRTPPRPRTTPLKGMDMADHAVENTHRIVVGVDGSPGSKNALKWAMNQARLTGATVEAITSWQDPAKHGTAFGWTSAAFEGDTYAITMVRVLDDTIAEVAAQTSHPGKVLAQVVEGHPVEALVRAATGADLLVVGSRGHGTFAGIMLGSVSQQCVQHAPCPVLVVR